MLTTSLKTLKEVLAQFSHWRKQKSHPREAIPEELWHQAITLFPEYSQKQICQTLGLNTSAFSTHRQKYQNGAKESEQTFVEVKRQASLMRTSHPHQRPLPLMEFERSDGCKLRLFETQGFPPNSFIQDFLRGHHAAIDSTNPHFLGH